MASRIFLCSTLRLTAQPNVQNQMQHTEMCAQDRGWNGWMSAKAVVPRYGQQINAMSKTCKSSFYQWPPASFASRSCFLFFLGAGVGCQDSCFHPCPLPGEAGELSDGGLRADAKSWQSLQPIGGWSLLADCAEFLGRTFARLMFAGKLDQIGILVHQANVNKRVELCTSEAKQDKQKSWCQSGRRPPQLPFSTQEMQLFYGAYHQVRTQDK